ncbi:MAG TPA: HDOD domain-containing protein [Steroidobacteraceae bacterium]|jgi:HD-like signal output (HDOD) protein|nr:HDOD domain-containing protein [Steroidobacteraceae bacterium]
MDTLPNPSSSARREPAAAASPPDPAAAEFLSGLLRELAVPGPLNLPCFPDIVPRVRRALSDPDAGPDDVARIVGTEPRLSARVQQTANSAVFNPGGRPSSNLRHAITRLGHQLVQSVTMVFAVQQMKSESLLRPVQRPLADLWEKSIAVASICQLLAQRLKVPADRAFLTGLLHGIGHFYVMVRAAAGGAVGYDETLAALAASRHPAIGAAVLEKWAFDGGMCETVAGQNRHDRSPHVKADLTDVLIASTVLAAALLEDRSGLARCAGVNAFDALGLGPDDQAAVLKHTELSLGTLRAALGA